MKTFDVQFGGVDYKVRNNQLTRRYWAEEIKAHPEMDNIESVVRYCFCLLRGFNMHFKLSFTEFEMYMDDEENTEFIKTVTELIQDLANEAKGNSNTDGEQNGKK